MHGLEYAPIVLVLATVAFLTLGSAFCALAAVMHVAERAAVVIAPLSRYRAAKIASHTKRGI